MERYTRVKGIYTYSYVFIYLYISKALRKERLSMFPKRGVPMETNAHSTVLLTYISGSAVKQPSLLVPLKLSSGIEMPRS
jgi:hypothetical protein